VAEIHFRLASAQPWKGRTATDDEASLFSLGQREDGSSSEYDDLDWRPLIIDTVETSQVERLTWQGQWDCDRALYFCCKSEFFSRWYPWWPFLVNWHPSSQDRKLNWKKFITYHSKTFTDITYLKREGMEGSTESQHHLYDNWLSNLDILV